MPEKLGKILVFDSSCREKICTFLDEFFAQFSPLLNASCFISKGCKLILYYCLDIDLPIRILDAPKDNLFSFELTQKERYKQKELQIVLRCSRNLLFKQNNEVLAHCLPLGTINRAQNFLNYYCDRK